MKKIGVDIADTIIDVWPSIMKEAEIFNKNHSNNPINKDKHLYLPEEIYNWSKEEKNEFWREYGATITFNTPISSEITSTIKYLKELKYLIYFVTAKSNSIYKDLEKNIIELLKKYDVIYDKIYTQISNKGLFCKEHEISYLIDDSFDNCSGAALNGVKGILLSKSYNIDRELLDNMYRIESFRDIKKIIKF